MIYFPAQGKFDFTCIYIAACGYNFNKIITGKAPIGYNVSEALINGKRPIRLSVPTESNESLSPHLSAKRDMQHAEVPLIAQNGLSLKERFYMKAFIERSGCISCGLCTQTCPEVFRFADDGYAEVYVDSVPQDKEDEAVESQDNCPTGVISVK